MDYYIVDAFTDKLFSGNPACVCVLEEALTDEVMQNIAFENNLSETAFIYKNGTNYKLRWFTPSFEIDLCGHATLAAAFVVFNRIGCDSDKVDFETASGVISVIRKGDLYEMTFPKRIAQSIMPKPDIAELLSFEPLELYSERDLYVIMENEEEVKHYIPDYAKLKKLNSWLGIVITAKGNHTDFVSRYFCPELMVEDPVTGSSHSTLVPIWSKKLGKNKLLAKQLSRRGGILYCECCNDNIKISGNAVIYSKGSILL
ncbi:PhzF family phenazine biosynthesis protein [Lachnospiraceae bacterium 45-W7]